MIALGLITIREPRILGFTRSKSLRLSWECNKKMKFPSSGQGQEKVLQPAVSHIQTVESSFTATSWDPCGLNATILTVEPSPLSGHPPAPAAPNSFDVDVERLQKYFPSSVRLPPPSSSLSPSTPTCQTLTSPL